MVEKFRDNYSLCVILIEQLACAGIKKETN